MKYYYCQSKFEHAVIEAHNSADAKEKFIGIINANLEDYAKLTVKDVDSCVVNVYFNGEIEYDTALEWAAKRGLTKRAADGAMPCPSCVHSKTCPGGFEDCRIYSPRR